MRHIKLALCKPQRDNELFEILLFESDFFLNFLYLTKVKSKEYF